MPGVVTPGCPQSCQSGVTNTFSNNSFGIKISKSDNSYSIGDSVGNANRFNDNTSYALYNYDSDDSLNATYIHWGSGSGPYHNTNIHGKGDAVGGLVNFSNWIGMSAVDSVTVTETMFGPQLAWPALQDNDVAKYYIFRSTDSTTSTLHDSTVSTELFYTDDRALRDSVYYYRVAAGDNSSDFGRLSTYDVGGIIPFEMVFAIKDVGVEDLTLQWDVGSDVDINEYLIYRSSNGILFTMIDSVLATDTTFINTGLTEGYQYWYKLKAENNDGKRTSFSPTDSVHTRLITPTNLSTTAVTENRIDLSWVDNTNQENGYLVERRFLEVEVWAVIDTRVNHSTIVAGLVGCQSFLLLNHRNLLSGEPLAELHCGRQAEDAPSNYNYVVFVGLHI